MLPIWSECQASVLGVRVADGLVYTQHISSHLGNNLYTDILGPHLMSERSLCALPAASGMLEFLGQDLHNSNSAYK